MSHSEMTVIRGWVYKKREHKSIIFIDLRTEKGILQCVINKNKVSPDVWNIATKLTQESCIEVNGSMVDQPRAPGGRELQVSAIKVYQIAESPYPLGKKEHSPDVLMRYRHLTMRSPRYQAIMKIRAIVMEAAREFFIKNGEHLDNNQVGQSLLKYLVEYTEEVEKGVLDQDYQNTLNEMSKLSFDNNQVFKGFIDKLKNLYNANKGV